MSREVGSSGRRRPIPGPSGNTPRKAPICRCFVCYDQECTRATARVVLEDEWSIPAKKYGWRQQQARERLRRVVDAGAAICARCGEPIIPGTSWALDHAPGGDPSEYLGPAYAFCTVFQATSPSDHGRPVRLDRRKRCARSGTEDQVYGRCGGWDRIRARIAWPSKELTMQRRLNEALGAPGLLGAPLPMPV